MYLVQDLVAFGRAIWTDWTSRMTGGIGALGILAASTRLSGSDYQSIVYIVAAVMLLVSCFRTWQKEHLARLAANGNAPINNKRKQELERQLALLSDASLDTLAYLSVYGVVQRHPVDFFQLKEVSEKTNLLEPNTYKVAEAWKTYLAEWALKRNDKHQNETSPADAAS